MMYNSYPYELFNADYLRACQRQCEAQRQREQNKNIVDLTRALSDFLEASRKVHPDFQKAAQDACAYVILEYMAKNNGGTR